MPSHASPSWRPVGRRSWPLAVLAFLLPILLLSGGSARAEDAWDPIEPVNRGIFKANDELDVHLFEPVARQYDEHVADPVKIGISNFFANLKYFSYLATDVVQLKFGNAWHDTERFAINTTIGVGGLCDVAAEWGIPRQKKDFGVALAYYDVPAGPYLVLPILGPTNLRDSVGLLVEGILDPFFIFSYFSQASSDVKTEITVPSQAVYFISLRAGLLDAVKSAKESSLDYYLFVQSAYYQYRRGLLYEGHPPPEGPDDIDGGDAGLFEPKENRPGDAK